PYYYGDWSPIRSYGWTWIGLDVWSWPTHHYGRWGYERSRWFWIPNRTWGPAWVSWAAAPGYVSWCPLGFDSRPVFALSIGGAGREGAAVERAVPRGAITDSRPSTNAQPSAAADGRTSTAVRRPGPGDATPTREFRQPLPDGFRTVDRRPAASPSASLEGPTP